MNPEYLNRSRISVIHELFIIKMNKSFKPWNATELKFSSYNVSFGDTFAKIIENRNTYIRNSFGFEVEFWNMNFLVRTPLTVFLHLHQKKMRRSIFIIHIFPRTPLTRYTSLKHKVLFKGTTVVSI